MKKVYKKLAKDVGVEERVEFTGHVDEERLISLYANSLFVAFTPFDEDLGFIAMEAMLSKKAVLTCTDSGGPLEFIEDNVNGMIAEPTTKKVAERMKTLCKIEKAKKLGSEGYKKINHLDLSWKKVIKKLP